MTSMTFGGDAPSDLKIYNPDPTLCDHCGGQPYVFERKDGVVLANDPGTAISSEEQEQ
jgi:hypothetical protein